MEEVEVPQFAGFRRPETEFYSTPNEWTDISADIDNLAELKIIEYIMRHTWGFKEKRNGKWVCDYDKARKISTDEFMSGRKRQDGSRMDKGTKLSKQSVITGVDKAAKHGYIEVETIKSEKYYKLKMLPPVKDLDKEETEGVKDLDRLPINNLDNACQEVRQVQAHKKETPEIQLQKETLKESRSSLLTSEQLRIDEWYCQHVTVPPKITDKLKEHWTLLALYIKTQEQMESLFEYTRVRIRGNDPRVHPGNLVNQLDAWRLEYAITPPPDGPQGTRDVEQPIYRESEPLPADMQEWMIETALEFGGDELACVNELEWCFQHTSCTEEEFYSKLVRAYQKTERSQNIDMFFADFKQSLSLIVDAVTVS